MGIQLCGRGSEIRSTETPRDSGASLGLSSFEIQARIDKTDCNNLFKGLIAALELKLLV